MLVRDIFAPMKAFLGLSTLLTAADADKIVTSTNMKVGAYTVAAQPSAPSLITVTATANGTADTMGTITVVGTDVYDRVLTEVIIPVAGSTVSGTRYFKTVTSVTGAGWVIDAGSGNDTITVGVPMSAGIEAEGLPVTLQIVSGNVWINDKITAVEGATAFKLTAGQTLDFVPRTRSLSLISDASGATFQAIIWGDSK
jgi:hypothetical protein